MHRPNETGRAGGATRLDITSSFPTDDSSNISPNLNFQARFLSRRFGVRSDRARLIAEIAFGREVRA